MSTWTRFVRFNAVSALGIGVQLAVLWLLTRAGVNYMAATVLAVAAAVIHNFVWHRQWTWADRETGVFTTFFSFVAANGAVSLATNLLVMAALVSGVGLSPLLASLVAIGSAGLVNFWLGDHVVFRGGTTGAPGTTGARGTGAGGFDRVRAG